MAQLGRAAKADDVLVWEHGRRLGVAGDGQSGNPSAIVLDGSVVASNRLATGNMLIKALLSLSAAGAVTFANVQPGDTVVSVTDLSSGADVTSSFETTISVAGQIQQSVSTSGHQVLAAVQLRS